MRERARRLFIAAVTDVMQECDKPGEKADANLKAGLKPFIEIAAAMARKGKPKRVQREAAE